MLRRGYYGPYRNWYALAVCVASDNAIYVLWTSDSGVVSLWRMPHVNSTSPPAVESFQEFTLAAGWRAVNLTAAGSHVYLMLQHHEGYIAFWRLGLDLQWQFGAQYPNAYAADGGLLGVDLAGDGSGRLYALLNHTSAGVTSLWQMDDQNFAYQAGANIYESAGSTEVGERTPRSIAVRPDGKPTILRTHDRGMPLLVTMEPANPPGTSLQESPNLRFTWDDTLLLSPDYFYPAPGDYYARLRARSLAIGPDNQARLLFNGLYSGYRAWFLQPDSTQTQYDLPLTW